MTPNDMAELRKKAEAATPGPWRTDFDDAIVGRPTWPCQRNQERGEWTVAVVDDLMGEYEAERSANQDYIAAASPDVLIALLDEIEKLRAANEWQPIETCPDDVLDVLVYCSDTEEQFVAYRDRQDRSLFIFATTHTGRKLMCKPTHYRPLPAPPVSTPEASS